MPAKPLFEDNQLIKLLYKTEGDIAACAAQLGAAKSSVYSRIQRTTNKGLKIAYSATQKKKEDDANLLGRRFGSRLVIDNGSVGKGGHQFWVCQCDCGEKNEVSASRLFNGRSHKCKKCSTVKHGKNRTPEHNAWISMKGRCENPKHPEYKNYGARGISICAEYRDDFKRFYADLGPRPSKHHSLGRIDNEKGYDVGNLRWETPEEQTNNRRVTLSVDGKNVSCIQLEQELGIDRETVRKMIKLGSTMDELKEYAEMDWHGKRAFCKAKREASAFSKDNRARKKTRSKIRGI